MKTNEKLVVEAFKKFDRSGDGVISSNDLSAALGMDQFGGRSISELFQEIGFDSQAGVNFEQFTDVLCNSPVRKQDRRNSTMEVFFLKLKIQKDIISDI